MKKIVILLFIIAFGLPFLLIGDLFPLHRFGMFARTIPLEQQESDYFISYKMDSTGWTKLSTGNEYMDAEYFPIWAKNAFLDSKKANQLVLKLIQTMPSDPDSICLICLTPSDSVCKVIFPRP